QHDRTIASVGAGRRLSVDAAVTDRGSIDHADALRSDARRDRTADLTAPTIRRDDRIRRVGRRGHEQHHQAQEPAHSPSYLPATRGGETFPRARGRARIAAMSASRLFDLRHAAFRAPALALAVLSTLDGCIPEGEGARRVATPRPVPVCAGPPTAPGVVE